jgi:hypothetical protein
MTDTHEAAPDYDTRGGFCTHPPAQDQALSGAGSWAHNTKGTPPMTNANLPERWLNDMRFRRKRLSDGAYRSYMQALMWSVANRTEGIIERGDLEDIPDFDPADVRELMGEGLWQPRGPDRGWLIADFSTTQTAIDGWHICGI